MKSQVQLQVIQLTGEDGESYQTVAINFLQPESLISVQELLTLKIPADLDPQKEIVLYGRAPLWLYCHLINRFNQASWLGCFDIRLKGVVVISSRCNSVKTGEIKSILFHKNCGSGILIVGPPNSGKSVLSYRLGKDLVKRKPDVKIYLHRANWDGEGNHTYETPDEKFAQRLADKNKFKIQLLPERYMLKSEYFRYQAEVTHKIRQVVDLALVDVGGRVETEKIPLIEQCSHYIVISNDPQKVADWHQLCGDKLQLLAVIHSRQEEYLQVLKTEPFLEIVAGKWERKEPGCVPDILLEKILRLVS